MGDLITLADAKIYLQIGFATDDALFETDLIPGFSAAVCAYCYESVGGVVAQTDILDGGYRELILKRRPIVSVTQIIDRIDGSIVDPSLYDLDIGTGMIMAGTPATNAIVGVIDLSVFGRSSQGDQIWGFGRRRWQAAYQHGYASVPLDVKMAVKILVSGRYNRRDDVGAETIGDYSYRAETGDKSGWPPQVEQLLAPYHAGIIG